MRRSRITRRAFSLLEMVLALALGMILLLALYLFMNTHLFHAQAGRDALAEGVLARTIMARIGSDIAGQLGPVDPRVVLADEAPAEEAPPSESTPPATPSATPSNGTPESPMPASPMPATPMMNSVQNTVHFNHGVQGTEAVLSLSPYRVRKPGASASSNAVEGEVTSDLKRTIYWMATNGTQQLGLARIEINQATGVDIDMDPASLPDQAKYVIAPEVKSIAFEYYANGWQGSWDGSSDDGLGGPPPGPPSAIRITIILRRAPTPGFPAADGDDPAGPTYQHIVALPTSNSFTPKTATTVAP